MTVGHKQVDWEAACAPSSRSSTQTPAFRRRRAPRISRFVQATSFVLRSLRAFVCTLFSALSVLARVLGPRDREVGGGTRASHVAEQSTGNVHSNGGRRVSRPLARASTELKTAERENL